MTEPVGEAGILQSMRLLSLTVAIAALAACATPSERIADALITYGLPATQAECVGTRLEQRLSIKQLRELARYARAYRSDDPDPRRVTIADLNRVASQVRDPQVPIELARAAGECGLISSPLLGLLQAADRS